MNDDPYAPPRAVVADITFDPTSARPWQVTLAVRLCWLSTLLTVPGVIDVLFRPSGDVPQSVHLSIMLAMYVPAFALFIVLYVWMARGYRWARVVYSALTLLGLLGMITSIPDGFARAWYLGVLAILVGLLGAATLWLLFTGAANTWFRTRGGYFRGWMRRG